MNNNQQPTSNKQIDSKALFAQALGQKAEPDKVAASEAEAKPQALSGAEAAEATAPPVMPPAEIEPAEATAKKRPVYLWLVAVAAMVVGAFFLGRMWAGQDRPAADAGISEATLPPADTMAVPPLADADTLLVDSLAAAPLSPQDTIATKLLPAFFEQRRIFIACFAMKKEANVLKKIAWIQSKAYDNAHYYWIPDVQEGGNRFFKIVLGPYPSEPAAQHSLDSVRVHINPEAYVLPVQKRL